MLGINAEPVTIKKIECAIIDHGFEQGWIQAQVQTNVSKHKFSSLVLILSGCLKFRDLVKFILTLSVLKLIIVSLLWKIPLCNSPPATHRDQQTNRKRNPRCLAL